VNVVKKRFNTTGVCVPRKHYMVDISNKLKEIEEMIENEEYFIINRPRQYGKTTTMFMLKKILIENHLVIDCSFEGIGDLIFQEEGIFSKEILKIFGDSIENEHAQYAEILYSSAENITNLKEVSKALTKFIKSIDQEVILLIDEVDKSSNNQLFLSFLGMLRNKYLAREQGNDCTFKSVILAGVHDIKNLKLKLRDNSEEKLNSPWNIAVKFNVDMSFNVHEIESMILDYCNSNNINMDTKEISKKIRYYTNGYPFLVSRLCQIINEDIIKENIEDKSIDDEDKRAWILDDIDTALKIILKEDNTLFNDLIKNLENNKEVYDFIKSIIIDGDEIPFVISDTIISQCLMYGIIRDSDGRCKIDNKIFELYIYNHMTSRVLRENKSINKYNFREKFITSDNNLNFEKVLLRFQQFMKEQYSSLDIEFIEREGRLLFLAFIKPIINGVGFDFKEVQISEEKRLDVVVTYNKRKYIIELKIWNGAKYHEKGIKQLCDYLDIHGLDKGYLVIFNFNKNKEYKEEVIKDYDKEIFGVFV